MTPGEKDTFATAPFPHNRYYLKSFTGKCTSPAEGIEEEGRALRNSITLSKPTRHLLLYVIQPLVLLVKIYDVAA